jgi:hypothetical protein
MTSKGGRPLLAQALRCGLVFAAAGLFVAIALNYLNPWIGFPEWGLLLWPSAILMMGLSGISESAARFWMVTIVASNAVLYFLAGVVLTPLIIFARRALAR